MASWYFSERINDEFGQNATNLNIVYNLGWFTEYCG